MGKNSLISFLIIVDSMCESKKYKKTPGLQIVVTLAETIRIHFIPMIILLKFHDAHLVVQKQ